MHGTRRTFEWDDGKARSNEIKHGLPFTDALAVFLDPFRADYDATHPGDGEAHRKAVGLLANGLVTVVYTHRGEAIRIISDRRANRAEERRYGDR
jgi:uncharacterized DUF497 family protein